jgi:hypothetical protein
LVAVLLASNPSQPNSLIVIRYSSQNNTVRDHVMITWCHRHRRSPPHVTNFGTAQGLLHPGDERLRHTVAAVTSSPALMNIAPSSAFPMRRTSGSL